MKKQILPLLALFALPLFSQGQTLTPARQRMAVSFAPNIAYFASNGPVGDQMPRPGFHARLDGEWRLNPRLWLRVGAGYSLLRYKTDIGKFLQWPSQVINGVYDPSLPGESYILLREDKMLTMPVALRYFMDKKQRFYADIESGASLVFVENSQDVLRPNVGAALGFQTAIGSQTWLFVQPAFRFIWNIRNGSEPLNLYTLHPYSFGLEMGVRRGL